MLEGLTPPTRKFSCKVGTVAASLDEKDRAILLAAVDNPDWGFKTLEKALLDKGIMIVDTTISSHRRKTCGCYR
jgi:hypothetical protein